MSKKIMPTSTGVSMDDLSNTKVSFKHIFKPLGKYIIIRSIGEIKEKKIIIPATGSYSQRKEWLDKETYVFEIGDEVTKVKVGDKVIINAHKLMRLDLITEMVEKKLNKKFEIAIEGTDFKQETEKYFAVTQDDIICVIN